MGLQSRRADQVANRPDLERAWSRKAGLKAKFAAIFVQSTVFFVRWDITDKNPLHWTEIAADFAFNPALPHYKCSKSGRFARWIGTSAWQPRVQGPLGEVWGASS